MPYSADAQRYDGMTYNRCGRSGLKLPAISLGLWHNFGGVDTLENARAMLRRAFDLGITHFDLANNYGPPPGNSERVFGKILLDMPREELIVSSKAGFYMWPGPYGEWGSRKNLLASLDQSLQRLKLDYVDIFYHHRPDPDTPLEETLGALDTAVRQGKALYAGISNYRGEQFLAATETVRRCGYAPILIHQPYYNMLDRWVEAELLGQAAKNGTGIIAFCPLAGGVLTDKYLDGLPPKSRQGKRGDAGKKWYEEQEARGTWDKVRALNEFAKERGQSMAQLALQWLLRDDRVTSVLIGASHKLQLADNLRAIQAPALTEDELARIEAILAG